MRLSTRQLTLLLYLESVGTTRDEKLVNGGHSRQTLTSLCNNGLVQSYKREIFTYYQLSATGASVLIMTRQVIGEWKMHHDSINNPQSVPPITSFVVEACKRLNLN